MTMTITNDIIGHPDGEHVCPCGCNRIVGDDNYWISSSSPREDLVATMDEKIAAGIAAEEKRVAAMRGRLDEALALAKTNYEELVAALEQKQAWGLEFKPVTTCVCCNTELFVDEYRQHVLNPPTWCDRERWGSTIILPGQDDDG